MCRRASERSCIRDSCTDIEERRTRARLHVEWGRLLIARYQQYLKELRESGRDTETAESSLLELERTQKIFERDLADLEKRE